MSNRNTEDRAVQIWLGHVEALAEKIGPRGSATEGEYRGVEYCRSVLDGLGLVPTVEEFPSSGSVFLPHLVAAACFLLALILYPLAPPLTRYLAAALAAATLLSELLELALRDNPLRWVLPKRPSRNVYATVNPAGEIKRDIVLIGHVDSQRTPIIFSSRAWLNAYRILSSLALLVFVAQTILYLYGAFSGAAWAWPASLPAAPFALLLLALVIHAELTPYTPGANDNATAVGLVLTLGEVLTKSPLTHSRVWLVCTGSEEALHEGARHFFAAHGRELIAPRTVNFEMLGCAGPAWLVREGIVLPLRPDPTLRRLADRIAAEYPHLDAYPARLSGGVTEASDAMNAGVPAITIMGLDRDNQAPYWHLPTDTCDKLRPEVMARTYAFVLALLQAIDAAE